MVLELYRAIYVLDIATTKNFKEHSGLRPVTQQDTSTMSFFRITLTRSGIGLPRRTRGVLEALGLRYRMQTVFYPVTPEVAGQIMKVKELVSVREVDKALTREELREERRPDPGYYVESAVPR